jgi:hypothetical protein
MEMSIMHHNTSRIVYTSFCLNATPAATFNKKFLPFESRIKKTLMSVKLKAGSNSRLHVQDTTFSMHKKYNFHQRKENMQVFWGLCCYWKNM